VGELAHGGEVLRGFRALSKGSASDCRCHQALTLDCEVARKETLLNVDAGSGRKLPNFILGIVKILTP
jgi:hypothetical protein